MSLLRSVKGPMVSGDIEDVVAVMVMGVGSSATNKGDDFNGIARFEQGGVTITPWNKQAIPFDCARLAGLAKLREQIGHGRAIRDFGGRVVDVNLHSRVMVPPRSSREARVNG